MSHIKSHSEQFARVGKVRRLNEEIFQFSGLGNNHYQQAELGMNPDFN